MFDRRINFVLDSELYVLVQRESRERKCSLGDVVRDHLTQSFRGASAGTPMPERQPDWQVSDNDK